MNYRNNSKDWSVAKDFKDLILVYVAVCEWVVLGLCLYWVKKKYSFSTEAEKKRSRGKGDISAISLHRL